MEPAVCAMRVHMLRSSARATGPRTFSCARFMCRHTVTHVDVGGPNKTSTIKIKYVYTFVQYI